MKFQAERLISETLLKTHLATALSLCAILARPIIAASLELLLFYENNPNCEGGPSTFKPVSYDCRDGRDNNYDIFQSVYYPGILYGTVEAYSVQGGNDCGVFVSSGNRCANSGHVPLITAAKLQIPSCKTPSLCFAMEQERSKARDNLDDLDDLIDAWAWTDIENDRSWVLVPGTFDESDFKKSKLSGRFEDFAKSNYTFYGPYSQLYDKKRWVYREANDNPN